MTDPILEPNLDPELNSELDPDPDLVEMSDDPEQPTRTEEDPLEQGDESIVDPDMSAE